VAAGPARVAADGAPGGAPRGSAGPWSRIALLGSAGRSVGGLALVALATLLLAWGPVASLLGILIGEIVIVVMLNRTMAGWEARHG